MTQATRRSAVVVALAGVVAAVVVSNHTTARTVGVAASGQPSTMRTVGDLAVLDPGPPPSIEQAAGWLNSGVLTDAQLRGKVVLFDFWTFACINCQHTVPHVQAWQERYASDGLSIISIHTPEFASSPDLDLTDDLARRSAELWLAAVAGPWLAPGRDSARRCDGGDRANVCRARTPSSWFGPPAGCGSRGDGVQLGHVAGSFSRHLLTGRTRSVLCALRLHPDTLRVGRVRPRRVVRDEARRQGTKHPSSTGDLVTGSPTCHQGGIVVGRCGDGCDRARRRCVRRRGVPRAGSFSRGTTAGRRVGRQSRRLRRRGRHRWGRDALRPVRFGRRAWHGHRHSVYSGNCSTDRAGG